jgi:hypothetical protein
MWASVRRYENQPELADALAARSDEVKELITSVDGFVSYYIIHDGSDTVSVTVAQDKAGVDKSNELAKDWLAEHASEVPSTPPHITEGEVLITTSG